MKGRHKRMNRKTKVDEWKAKVMKTYKWMNGKMLRMNGKNDVDEQKQVDEEKKLCG